jgi:hypothetical protein
MLKLYRRQVHNKGTHSLEFMISIIFHTFFCDHSLNSEVRLHYKKKRVHIFNYYEYDYPCCLLNPMSSIFKIPSQSLIILLKALLLEKKIILVSSLYENNAVLIESLIWLMFPMYIIN